MKKKKRNFGRLIFEFISISFAVIAALLVNQWREDHNNGKLAEKSVHNIREELIENHEVLDQLIPKHKSRLVSLDSLIIVYEKEQSITDSTGSLEVVLISSSAWEMAKITKAVYYMDFDNVNNLAKVYDLQSYYESIVKQYVLNNSYEVQSADIESIKKGKAFLKTIIPMEEDLNHYYQLILNEVLTSEK